LTFLWVDYAAEPKYLLAGQANSLITDQFNPTVDEFKLLTTTMVAPGSRTPIYDGRILRNKILASYKAPGPSEPAIDHYKFMSMLADEADKTVRGIEPSDPKTQERMTELRKRMLDSYKGAVGARFRDVDIFTTKELNKIAVLKDAGVEVKTEFKPDSTIATIEFRKSLDEMFAKNPNAGEGIIQGLLAFRKYRAEDGKGGKHIAGARLMQQGLSKLEGPSDGC
jgi:hypothetical protein